MNSSQQCNSKEDQLIRHSPFFSFNKTTTMKRAAFLRAPLISPARASRPLLCRRRNGISMKRTLDASGVEFIRLDNFIKLQGAATTGGHAKMMITGGEVVVNGDTETRRGRKLREGDTVSIDGTQVPVHFDEDEE